MSEWREITLGDAINLKRGYDLPQRLRVDGDVPIYSSSGVFGFHNEAKDSGLGVITGRYGTVGQVFLARGPYWPLNTTLYVEDFKGNDEIFIFYFLKQIRWEKFNDKSAVPGINRNDVHSEIISLPPLDEQRRIAAVLSTLDAKIDLLRRQNHTLEQIAQTLFNRWFVEFEFPVPFDRSTGSRLREHSSAELAEAEHGQPYRTSGGPMQPSELGEIPLGWRVGTFLELFDLLSGGTPKTSVPEYWDGEIKWISGKDATANHRKFILSTEKQITEDGLNNSATKLLPQFTTVISARGTVGCYCLLPEPMCMSQTNYGIRPKDDRLNFFTYLSVSSIVELLKRRAYGTVFDTITTVTFKQSEIVIPPSATLLEFEGVVSLFFRKMLVNETQIQTLTRLRDTLLPKLMSGKLRVAA